MAHNTHRDSEPESVARARRARGHEAHDSEPERKLPAPPTGGDFKLGVLSDWPAGISSVCTIELLAT